MPYYCDRMHWIPFWPFLSPAASRPLLRQLHRVSSAEGTVKIKEGVAAEWKELAIQLDFQPGTIKIIRKDNDSCEDAFDDLMSRWLEGAGRQPVSWGTLLLALKEANFKTLASDVKGVLNL